VRNLEVVPLQSDIVQRELIRPYLGNYEQLLANTRVQVTFEVELAGSGTAGTPPAYGPILRSCALSETLGASTSVLINLKASSVDLNQLLYISL
jgi:hypothetical protein